MVAMLNWFYTRRGTYYMLHFSILGLEGIFGWRAEEFYRSLFSHLDNGLALGAICDGIGLIVWIFGFALSTHYRFAVEAVIELERKRASVAINEQTVKILAYGIVGAAIALVLANDVAGAVYLSLQANLDTPQFVMAIIGLCAFIALPFLVGYFLPALAASLPAEEQALVLDALLRQTWDLLRYESEHRVKKHMNGIRRGEVHAFTSFAEAIDALLSGADPSLPHVQALLKLKEAGALNFQGAAGTPSSSIHGAPVLAIHAGPATHGASLNAGAWSQVGSGRWATDLSLTEAVEELAEQDDLEVTEAEVLEMQRRGKITLYKDSDGAWRIDLKNYVLLKQALGLDANFQPVAQIAPAPEDSPPVEARSFHTFTQQHHAGSNEHASTQQPMSDGHLASPTATNGIAELAPAKAMTTVQSKPSTLSPDEMPPKRGEIRSGIAAGVIPADYTSVTVAECAVVSGYSEGHIRNMIRKGSIQTTEKRQIPAEEALRLYQVLRQALQGSAGITEPVTAGASGEDEKDME